MTNSAKLIGIIVAILVVLGVVWWYMHSGSALFTPTPVGQTSSTAATDNTQQTAAASNGTLTTSPSDTSDASLNSDMSSIDGGMNSLNSDSNTAASANN
jgi:cytoskeletal protein RodZ